MTGSVFCGPFCASFPLSAECLARCHDTINFYETEKGYIFVAKQESTKGEESWRMHQNSVEVVLHAKGKHQCSI